MNISGMESSLDETGNPVENTETKEVQTEQPAQEEKAGDKPETQAEESSLETEEKEESETEAQSEAKAEGEAEETNNSESTTHESESTEDEDLTDDEVFEVLSERLPKDTDIKSLQDLVERLKKPEPLPEFLQKQKEWMDNGGTPEEFYQMNMVNYDEMSTDVAAENMLREKYPDWSDSDIKAELEETYGLLPENHEDYDEKSVARGQRKLKADVAAYRNSKKDQQEKFRADLSQRKPSGEEVDQEEITRNQQAFIKDYTSAAKELKGIEFEEGFKYEFDNEYKSQLEEFTSKGDPLADYVDKEGKIDHKGLAVSKALKDHLPKIVKNAIAYGKSIQNKETIEQAKNPSYKPENKDVPQVKKTAFQELSDQLPNFRQ